MKRILIFVLIAILLFLLPISLGNAQESPQIADYNIPNPINASSQEEFNGIWEVKYVSAYNQAYTYESLGGSKITLEIYNDRGIGVAGGQSFYLQNIHFQDGKLFFLDGDTERELILQDDGNASITLDGVPFYCVKISPEYEKVDYRSLARNPEKYNGKYAIISGTVIQTIGTRTGDYYQIRMANNNNYDEVILAEFINIPDYNLLENDQITIWVRLAGEYSYEAVWGNVVTVPIAFVHSVELNE